MKELFEKSLRLSMGTSLLFITFGLLLAFFSNMTIALLAFLLGICIIAGSLKYLYIYVKDNTGMFDLGCFIIMLVFGLVVMFRYDFFAGILPFILGFVILISSASKLQMALYFRKEKKEWIFSCVLASIGCILGFLFIFNPFKSALLITQVIGIYMIAYGVVDFVEFFVLKKNVEKFHKTLKKKVKIIDEK